MTIEANVILSISEHELENEYITKSIGIEPTDSWKKGDPSEYSAFKQYSCWQFETGYKETYDIDELLEVIYSTFNHNKDKIRDLSNNFDLYITLEIVIKMSENETPGLHFSKNIISFLNHIGAEIDIDMYIN